MNPELIAGGLSVDDRGQLAFVNDFDFESVKRFYVVSNHKSNFVRAWHGHLLEQKWVFVITGSALVGCVKMQTEEGQALPSEPERFVLTSSQPKILRIPAGYANGFMTLEEDTKVVFFSDASLEQTNADDIRFPYDHWDIWNIEPR